jgi:hypothetical protein
VDSFGRRNKTRVFPDDDVRRMEKFQQREVIVDFRRLNFQQWFIFG